MKEESLKVQSLLQENIDKPQLPSVSGAIFTVSHFGERYINIAKVGGSKPYSGYPNPKSQYPPPLPGGYLVHPALMLINISYPPEVRR